MNNNISIAAAIIAKNAEDTIGDTIKSILPFCEQIIVVDTGSDDRTPFIATELGAEVYFHKWTDDFSEARNFSLNFARKDWILIIDTDEVLDSESFITNLDLLNDDRIGGINLIVKNYLDSNQEQFSIHRYTRIFRNHPQIRFEGRVHEQIHESIRRANFSIAESDIMIHHFGYNIGDSSKKNRNLEILKEETDKSSNDFYLKYHLAMTEFSLGNLVDAKEIFEQIADSNLLSTEQNEMTKIRLAQINLSQNNLETAEQWLRFESQNDNLEGFRQFVLAAIKMSQNNFLDAKTLYANEKVQNSSYVDKNIIIEANKLLTLM